MESTGQGRGWGDGRGVVGGGWAGVVGGDGRGGGGMGRHGGVESQRICKLQDKRRTMRLTD